MLMSLKLKPGWGSLEAHFVIVISYLLCEVNVLCDLVNVGFDLAQLSFWMFLSGITHWGQVTHICISKLTIIDSDNGLSPGGCQAITWTSARIVLIGPLGTYFSDILVEIYTFSFKKMHLKMLSGKWQPFCLSLNVKSQPKFIHFHSWKCIWKCRLENGGHFVSASMWLLSISYPAVAVLDLTRA